MQFARGLSTETADTFVGMYVNNWTLDMGPQGKESIRLFLKRAADQGIIPAEVPIDFVD
jgi:1,4-dihydroxy-6-naphthoate synthase